MPKLDLFDSIRVKSKKKEAQKPIEHGCDHEGCTKKGQFRAPKGRDREKEYFFFCDIHVKEYNAKYNYFVGLGDDDIRTFQKDAFTGHRPTWTMGVKKGKIAPETLDPFKLFSDTPFKDKARPTPEEEENARVGLLSRKAFDALGLRATASGEEVKARFKELAKRYHPDSNGGDRSKEEELRTIMQAYKQLKAAGFAG